MTPKRSPDDTGTPCGASPGHPSRRHFLTSAVCAALTPAWLSRQANAATASPPLQRAGYTIDTSISSPNQESRDPEARIDTLVLHYTEASLDRSLDILTDASHTPAVSAHYVVPDTPLADGRFNVYNLVPEVRLAHHAGVSAWMDERMLNGTSIGIEIVNLGFLADHAQRPLMERSWYSFPHAQMDVVGQLATDIIRRYGIVPNRVVGHSDIAPGRKVDPGPLFPWKMLFKRYRVGAWPDAATVAFYRNHRPYDRDVAGLQEKLLKYGYDTPQSGELDAATTNVIASFQMHFCARNRYDGIPDVQTVAVLDALLEKYCGVPRPSGDA